MNVYITNIPEFINSIHDFVLETYEIIPRGFEATLLVGDKALAWHTDTEKIEEFTCSRFNKSLHVHENYNDPNLILCCNEVDVIAIKYLSSSIFGKHKREIISSLHSWLPAATFIHVKAHIRKFTKTIKSYFEPSYLFYFMENVYHSNDIVYMYFNSNIVLYENYTLKGKQSLIMVTTTTRRRSRSRSRSPSRSGGSTTKSAPRARSRSRSSSPRRRKTNTQKRTRSPKTTKSTRTSRRRRSRSRSSSR